LSKVTSERLKHLAGWVGRLTDEEAIELADQKVGGHRLFQHDSDDVIAVPGTLPAEDGFRSIIVEGGVIVEPIAVGVPTRESAGSLTNVDFGIVPHAEAEQLHEFPSIILVGSSLDVIVRI